MKDTIKETLVEKIVWYAIIPLLVVPLTLGIYLEKEIDQLGVAFDLAFKYTIIPFVFFFSILFFIYGGVKYAPMRVIQLSLIYSIISTFPALLINNHFGVHNPVTISGTIIDKKPGKGGNKAYLIVKNSGQEISFRIPRKLWKRYKIGDPVNIEATQGYFGLIYR